jgi:hypothetical protein
MVDTMSARRHSTTRIALIGTFALVAAIAVDASTTSAGSDPSAALAPAGDVGNVVEAVPRERRVVVFSDSVGLGARTQIPAAFGPGWQVHVEGQPARFVKQMESQYVRPRLASNPEWFGDHVVMAAGYNAPLLSSRQMDPVEFDRQLDSMMATLTAAGVKHVHWITLREVDPQYISASAWRQIQPYYWYFPQVNERLEAALARHPNLTLVDWAANANRAGLTYDAIHLNPTGAALFAELIRQSVETSATRVPDGSTTRIRVPGGAGAAAAMVNLTTTNPRRVGHLTVHRCNQPPPTASVHNYVRDQVTAHATIAPLDANGDFCVTTPTATNLVVDVTGTLRAGSGFTSLTPTRWRDTRKTSIVRGGTSMVLDLDAIRATAGIVGDPAALAMVVTAVDAHGVGHVTVSTCGSDADHSNVNFTTGAATPNLVFVAPDAQGRVCLFTPTTTHLVVDLMGVFDASAGISVATPDRLHDSRRSGGKLRGGVLTLDVGSRLGSDATGAILNITGLLAEAPGHFTVYPCASGMPTASNLNLVPGEVVANAVVIAPDANGRVCVASHSTAHVVVDLLGEIGDVLTGRVPVRVLDTRRG